MTIEFWAFSDAVMAALASRSHEWLTWELRECEESRLRAIGGRETEFAPALEKKTLTLSLSVEGKAAGRMGHAVLSADPAQASPSDFVSRAVREAAKSDVAAFEFSNDLPTRAQREAEILERGEEKLREAVAQLESELAALGAWTLEVIIRRFRVKNTRALWSAFTETEVTLRLGAKVAFNGAQLDVSAIRKALATR